MTPLQVQFCYYVAHGNVQQAEALMPKLIGNDSLFNGSPSAAVFCVWAAMQESQFLKFSSQNMALFDNQLVLNTLAEHYPDVSEPLHAKPQIPESIEKTVSVLLVPAIKNNLHSFMLSIMKPSLEKNVFDTPARRFTHTTCAAAIQFVLTHDAFNEKDHPNLWKDLTLRMLGTLLTNNEPPKADVSSSSKHEPPATVKAILDEKIDTPAADYNTFVLDYKNQMQTENDGGLENVDRVLLSPSAKSFLPSRSTISGSSHNGHYHCQVQLPPENPSFSRPPMPNSLLRVLNVEFGPRKKPSSYLYLPYKSRRSN